MLVRLLNLVLPGTGLILRRREWLGFSLAMVFGISGNIALAGWLIAPMAVPPKMTGLAFILSGMSWLAAQVLLHREAAAMRRQSAQLRALVDAARAALDHGDLESAKLELESGLALDDECAEVYLLRARLCGVSGDEQGANANRECALGLQRKQGRRSPSPTLTHGAEIYLNPPASPPAESQR